MNIDEHWVAIKSVFIYGPNRKELRGLFVVASGISAALELHCRRKFREGQRSGNALNRLQRTAVRRILLGMMAWALL